MIWLARISFFLMVLDFIFMGYLTVTGFPPELAGAELRLKNMRRPFLAFLIFGVLFLLFHPEREQKIARFKERLSAFASKPYAIWILAGAYALLFLWQQLTEYYGVQINFIPFGFFDYILYYFFQGKVNFTGWLHRYYHLNNIMIVLAPFWYVFKSPLFLEVIYGFLAAAAAVPLYGIARERFQEPGPPLLVAFIYLNYRYLQNVLLMNFCVEIFYPLFIFSALYFAMKERWRYYFLCVLLGLLVKEDSFLYFGALAAVVAALPRQKKKALPTEPGVTRFVPLFEEPKTVPVRSAAAFFTVVLSFAYFAFLTQVFIPVTGNDIWKDNLNNFEGYGASSPEILGNILREPSVIFQVLFGTPEKIRTWFNVLSRLAFLPLGSPAAALITVPVFPLFFHSTGRDTDFVDLRFHYAAAVLPFVFIAFVFGFSNILRMAGARRKQFFLWLGLVLIFLNGGNYVTRTVNAETIKSIQWARRVPQGANLVTHGHLLPYVGYREYNYYFSLPLEHPAHPAHRAYTHADYYLIDFNVDPYPMDRGFLMDKVKKLEKDPAYLLLAGEGERYLFKRKDYRSG